MINLLGFKPQAVYPICSSFGVEIMLDESTYDIVHFRYSDKLEDIRYSKIQNSRYGAYFTDSNNDTNYYLSEFIKINI